MLVIHVRTQLAVKSAMVTPEADPETSAMGAQLVRREELQNWMQLLVQRVLADGGTCQLLVAATVVSNWVGGAAWYEDLGLLA